MGINFGDFTSEPQQTTQSSTNVLNLQKNDILNLTKRNPGLKKVNLAAGWDVAMSGADFDLDIAAYLLDDYGKIHGGEDVVFFNHMEVPGVRLNGDNRTGAGEGDDEVISIDFSKLSPSVSKIVFAIAIFEADKRRQSFGMVNNSYVRVLDVENNEKEICRYPLKENFSTETAVIVAELFKENGEWSFKAVGNGKRADFNGIAGLYM